MDPYPLEIRRIRTGCFLYDKVRSISRWLTEAEETLLLIIFRENDMSLHLHYRLMVTVGYRVCPQDHSTSLALVRSFLLGQDELRLHCLARCCEKLVHGTLVLPYQLIIFGVRFPMVDLHHQ